MLCIMHKLECQLLSFFGDLVGYVYPALHAHILYRFFVCIYMYVCIVCCSVTCMCRKKDPKGSTPPVHSLRNKPSLRAPTMGERRLKTREAARRRRRDKRKKRRRRENGKRGMKKRD